MPFGTPASSTSVTSAIGSADTGGGSAGFRPGQGSQSREGFEPTFSEEFFFGTAEDKHVPAKAIPVTSGVQDAALNELLAFLSLTLSGVDPGIGGFTAELPGPSGLQAASLAGLERIGAGESGVFQATENDAALQALQAIIDRGPEQFTDFFEQGIADPAQRDLERALAEINASAVGSGNLFGSDRQKASRDITADFFRNLGEERARFGLQTLGRDTQDELAAIGLMPGFIGADAEQNLEIGQRLFDIGARERAQGIEQITLEREEFVRQENMLLAFLELLLRGGTSPTFGIAGGFDLGPPSPASGGFLEGLGLGG